MSNIDRPNGFRPIGHTDGSSWNGVVEMFELDTSHLLVGVGDLITMQNTGFPNQFAAGDAQCIGVMVGVVPAGAGWSTTTGTFGSNQMSSSEPTLIGVSSRSVPVNTAGTIIVATSPDLVVVGQEDGDTDPLELLDVGANVEITSAGVDTTTGNSTMEINSDTHNTTATLPLRLLGLYNSVGNELASVDTTKPWTQWRCAIANHAYSGQAVGI